MTNDAAELSRRIDVVESSYEFLLAYAAQGRQDDRGSEARARLTALHDALEGLATLATKVLDARPQAALDVVPFLDALAADARAARGAVALVLRKPAIPSLLVDNLNASVHVRALLTDVFLVEQSLREPVQIQLTGSTAK
ncbi:MAG: hypothetical protein ABW136_08780 [Steroidobacteraceae bacterium]